MASAFPLRPAIEHTPRAAETIDLTHDDSRAVLESLASETARAVLSTLADGPATASDVAAEVGTSLQNVHYHLTNLQEADLVTEAGTWYSEKGREMTVYAVTSERLELHLGHERSSSPEPSTGSAGAANRPVVEGE